MCGENIAKNCPKCCQIAKISVAIISGKAWKTPRIFFLLLCGHPGGVHQILKLFSANNKEQANACILVTQLACSQTTGVITASTAFSSDGQWSTEQSRYVDNEKGSSLLCDGNRVGLHSAWLI